MAATFYIPTSHAWEFWFLYQHLLISSFFILDIIVNRKWYLMVWCIYSWWRCCIYLYNFHLHSFPGCCCCSVAQSCPTLCDAMGCSTPGFPVPHHLPEFAQVRVHCVGNAVQPSHLLTPSSPSALDLSQHQGFSSVVYICITSICIVSMEKSLCRSFAYFIILFIYLFLFFICSEFCHTLKRKGLGFTCLPHPDPPSHLPPHPLPPGNITQPLKKILCLFYN